MTGRAVCGSTLLLAALLMTGVAEARPIPGVLAHATALDCRLDPADSGNPVSPQDAFTFDSLDGAGHAARLHHTGMPPAKVWMLATPTTLSFVATTTQGSVIVTTVFDAPDPTTPLLLVQSRHLTGMTGIPQVAQRTGECRPRPGPGAMAPH